jgi:hypothetical protein
MLRSLLIANLVFGACALQKVEVVMSPDASAMAIIESTLAEVKPHGPQRFIEMDERGSLVEESPMVATESDPCVEYSTFRGKQFPVKKCQTFKQCQELCASTPGCSGMSWRQKTGKCRLYYSTDKSKNTKKKYWSGSANCELPPDIANADGDLMPDNGCNSAEAPTTAAPTTEAPTTAAPTTEAPTTAAPTPRTTLPPSAFSKTANTSCEDNDGDAWISKLEDDGRNRFLDCEVIRNAERTGVWVDSYNNPIDPDRNSFRNTCIRSDVMDSKRQSGLAEKIRDACRKSCGCCTPFVTFKLSVRNEATGEDERVAGTCADEAEYDASIYGQMFPEEEEEE